MNAIEPTAEACTACEMTRSNYVPYQYVISLRIWHPVISHEAISETLGRQPKFCWTVGTPRLSPKGTPLGGLRELTYWSAELIGETATSELIEVEQALAQELDKLEPVTGLFARIRNEGGKVELFVGLFSETNVVIDLEPSLMARLSGYGLGICLNYYPWAR